MITYSIIFGFIMVAGLGLDAYKLLSGRGKGAAAKEDGHKNGSSGDGSLLGGGLPGASEPGTDKSSSQGMDKLVP